MIEILSEKEKHRIIQKIVTRLKADSAAKAFPQKDYNFDAAQLIISLAFLDDQQLVDIAEDCSVTLRRRKKDGKTNRSTTQHNRKVRYETIGTRSRVVQDQVHSIK
jgi:hypothetical protein